MTYSIRRSDLKPEYREPELVKTKCNEIESRMQEQDISIQVPEGERRQFRCNSADCGGRVWTKASTCYRCNQQGPVGEEIQLRQFKCDCDWYELSQSSPMLLTRKTLQEHDRQTSTEVRQFHCRPCYNMWWRVVPSNKPVSRCKVCHRRYDAVPRNDEYRVGRFTCTNKLCGNVFYRRCNPFYTAFCPKCEAVVSEPHIHPKYNKYRPAHGPWALVPDSTPHISTGSTVETWLSQTAAASSRTPSPPIRHPVRLPDRPPSPPIRHPVSLPDSPVLKRRSSFHGSTHSLYGHDSCGSHGSGHSVASVGSRGFDR